MGDSMLGTGVESIGEGSPRISRKNSTSCSRTLYLGTPKYVVLHLPCMKGYPP